MNASEDTALRLLADSFNALRGDVKEVRDDVKSVSGEVSGLRNDLDSRLKLLELDKARRDESELIEANTITRRVRRRDIYIPVALFNFGSLGIGLLIAWLT